MLMITLAFSAAAAAYQIHNLVAQHQQLRDWNSKELPHSSARRQHRAPVMLGI